MGGEADADAHVGEGVFEDEVPADDPGDEFAEGGVGVGVGRSGDGNHGREFGVAEAGEDADDGDEDQREGEGGSGAGAAGHGGVGDEVVDQGGVADFGSVKLLSGHGGADDGEDAGADDGTDAERGERPGTERLFERVLGLFRSRISLSMDLRASSWLGRAVSPRSFGRRAGLGGHAGCGPRKPEAEVYMIRGLDERSWRELRQECQE